MRQPRPRHSLVFRRIVLVMTVAMVVSVAGRAATAQEDRGDRIRVAEKIDLARLVDLASEQLGFSIEYDERLLGNISVLLRLRDGVTAAELWNLTNRLLASHGFTSVQPPGSDLVSIVKLGEASDLQQIDREPRPGTGAGYTSLIHRAAHRTPEDLVAALKPILSKAGGTVTRLGATDLILVSDVTPRVEQAFELMEELDAPGETVRIERHAARYVPASQLAVLVTTTVEVRRQVEPRGFRGKITPTPDGTAIILVAPEPELPAWRDLIEQLDHRESVVQRTYTPRAFAVSEVATLIEQVGRSPDQARGSGDRWRVVANELTGTLIVTATPTEHERIASLMAELDEAPMEIRRPLRAFTIRNRSVRNIATILRDLIATGALGEDAVAVEPDAISPDDVLGSPAAPLNAGTSGAAASGAPRRGARFTPANAQAAGRPSGGAPLILTADEDTNTLIAIGEARLLSQLEQIIQRLDVRQPQVMLEVLVVSLTEGDTRDLGVELRKLEISGSTLVSLSSIFGLGSEILSGLANADDLPDTTARGFTGAVLNPGDFSILIRALETVNDGRSVTMPWVLVNNNQQGVLDAVIEEPFVSTNASSTVATTSFGGTTPAGTQVTVTPQIAEGDHLILEYAVSLSAFVGEASAPGVPPPRQQNSIQSVVTIPDGYTVAVGGIQVVNEADAASQVPLIGSIPILGELFKSRSESSSHSRLYAFIRANVLRHTAFEDLKFISDRKLRDADLDSGWPEVEPRIIR